MLSSTREKKREGGRECIAQSLAHIPDKQAAMLMANRVIIKKAIFLEPAIDA